jgi:peptidoglycan LD-endopeptidase LytH
MNHCKLNAGTPTAIATFVLVLILAAAAVATAIESNEVPSNISSSTVIGVPIEGLKVSDLRDSFNELHNGHRHEAIDIMRPRGTPVHAVIRGTIRKLYRSSAGGNTVYE